MSKAKIDTEQIFKENKDVNVLYKTADGQVFIRENRAKLHANSLPNGKQKVVEVKIDIKDIDVNQPEELDLTSADDIIDWAEQSDSPDSLQEYLKAENERKKPRVTVVEALENRLEELKKDK